MKTLLSTLRLLLLFPVARRHLVHLGFLALFSTWLLPFWGQRHEGLFHTSKTQSARFRAMEWNVENLYDTLHDVGFDDREFLPNAERRWNTPRYFHKQSSLAKTILAAGGLQPVDLVALCEVENDSVMHFLCRRTRLARLGYEYLVTHSADRRGIDVALLYQPETFALLHSETYRVPYDSLRERPTRDLPRCYTAKPTAFRTTVCENAPPATYFMPPAASPSATHSTCSWSTSPLAAAAPPSPNLTVCAPQESCAIWPTASPAADILRAYWPWAISMTSHTTLL